MAPLGLRERMTELIDREIAHAKAGKEAYLIAKMNSLIDQPMIEKNIMRPPKLASKSI